MRNSILSSEARFSFCTRDLNTANTSTELGRQGGTLSVALRRADSWSSGYLMHVFCKLSEVQLYKQRKAYTKGWSFYMVACDTQSQSLEALRAVGTWKEWKVGT